MGSISVIVKSTTPFQEEEIPAFSLPPVLEMSLIWQSNRKMVTNVLEIHTIFLLHNNKVIQIFGKARIMTCSWEIPLIIQSLNGWMKLGNRYMETEQTLLDKWISFALKWHWRVYIHSTYMHIYRCNKAAADRLKWNSTEFEDGDNANFLRRKQGISIYTRSCGSNMSDAYSDVCTLCLEPEFTLIDMTQSHL